MREQVPLVMADGAVEYWSASTKVLCGKPRGGSFGRKARDDGTMKLHQLGRQERSGARVTLPDGQEATIEGWGEEIARLQQELAALRDENDKMRGDVAPTWARQMVSESAAADESEPP